MYNKPFIVLLVLGISSFAVPNRVRAQDAAEKGRSHATLGIIAEPTEKDASRPGVVVRAVTPNGPAAAAGMKMGDVIVKLGDQEVKDFDGLVNSLAKQKPGDKLAVHVLRDGNEKTFTVTLAERLQGPPPPSGGFFREKPAAYLGVQMQELTPEAKERLGVTVEKGVELTDVMPGTPAEAAGLKRGDVITHCDNRVISNP